MPNFRGMWGRLGAGSGGCATAPLARAPWHATVRTLQCYLGDVQSCKEAAVARLRVLAAIPNLASPRPAPDGTLVAFRWCYMRC